MAGFDRLAQLQTAPIDPVQHVIDRCQQANLINILSKEP
jgi:hypothetical protein